MTITTKHLVATLAIATILTACGASAAVKATDTSQPATAAVPSTGATSTAVKGGTADELKASAEKYSNALFGGDYQKAYKFFSAECRKTLSYGDFVGQTTFGMAMLEGMFKVKASELVYTITDDDVTVNGASGTTGGTLTTKDGLVISSAADSNSKVSVWVYEDSGWRSTDCTTTSP